MPNGIMKGNGSKSNPWIVEDGWDLNELRNLPTTEFQWVEIENNISLAAFANWVPIPLTRLNIEGNGCVISDLHISTTSGHAGLFSRLITQETKNLTIDGEITCRLDSNNGAGLFCGNLEWHVTNSTTPQTSNCSNIRCFGSISATASAANAGVGGCIGAVFGQTNLTFVIDRCSFHGVLTFGATHSSSASPSGTQFRACSGILGDGNSNSSASNTRVELTRCLTKAQFACAGGPSPTGLGGILGGSRAALGSSVSRCIAQSHFSFVNSNPTTQPLWLAGISPIEINQCACASCGAIMQIDYSPPATIGGLNVGGIQGFRSSSLASSVSTSYAVIDFRNPNNMPLPATNAMRGIGQSVAPTATFFDSTVLAKGWSGSVVGSEHGRTTAQLQNRAYLESQGWVFSNV